MTVQTDAATPLRGYLAVLRRRKLYVALAIVLTPAVGIAYSLTESKRYEATAKVLLTSQDFAAALNGSASTQVNQDPNRVAQTQLEIARVPALAERVIRRTHLSGVTPEAFLKDSHVSAAPVADVLDFRVTDSSRAGAERLATAYATEFTKYRRELDAAAYLRAGRDLAARIEQLRRNGQQGSRLYENLRENREQLRTLATLGVQDAVLLRAAYQAAQVQPRPVRTGILAALLGVLLGLATAAVAEALDTRTRSTTEIAEALGMPLLGRVPASSARNRRLEPLAMLRDPLGSEAEAFRIVRANLDFLLRKPERRTIMVTSALGVEGKSTTLANLGIALALAGRHVVVVDLDLRGPSLAALFGISAAPGLSDVAAGRTPIDGALIEISTRRGSSTTVARTRPGRLEVLPAGTPVTDPGELVGREGVRDLLRTLRQRADVVLVDTPPLLQVGDAATLTDAVDGVLIVVRSSFASHDELSELRRVLSNSPADTIGFVLTGARSAETAGYGRYPRRVGEFS